MKYLLTFVVVSCLCMAAQTQNTFRAIIKGGEYKMPLVGATVTWKEKNKTAVADTAGLITIADIPNGTQTFVIS